MTPETIKWNGKLVSKEKAAHLLAEFMRTVSNSSGNNDHGGRDGSSKN